MSKVKNLVETLIVMSSRAKEVADELEQAIAHDSEVESQTFIEEYRQEETFSHKVDVLIDRVKELEEKVMILQVNVSMLQAGKRKNTQTLGVSRICQSTGLAYTHQVLSGLLVYEKYSGRKEQYV